MRLQATDAPAPMRNCWASKRWRAPCSRPSMKKKKLTKSLPSWRNPLTSKPRQRSGAGLKGTRSNKAGMRPAFYFDGCINNGLRAKAQSHFQPYPRLESLSITHKYEFRGFGEEFGLLSDPKRGQSLLLAGREDRRFKGILVNV